MGSQTAAIKFTGVRMLSVLGWRMSLNLLAGLAVAAWVVLVVTVLASSLFVLRLIRDSFPMGQPGDTGQAAVLALSLAACLYLAVGAWAREAFSSRRFAVRCSPNRGLYRSVDIKMHHVFVAEAAPRITLLFGLSAAITVAALIALHEGSREVPPAYGVLWFLPFLVPGSWLAVSSRFAAVDPPRTTMRRWLTLGILGCVVVGVPGVVFGRVLTALFDSGDLPALVVPAGWVIPAAAVLSVAFAGLVTYNLASIKRDPFPVTAQVVGTSAPRVTSVASGSAHLLFRSFLIRNILKDKAFGIFTGIGVCLLLAASLALGLCIGGIGPELFRAFPGMSAIAALVVFMVSLIGSELMSKGNNPAGLLPHLRYAWEAGIPVTKLAYAVVLTQALPLTVLAAPTMAVIVWTLTGNVPVALVFIPWSIAMASIIGNTFSRVLAKQADGSMETSIAAAFIAVVLAVPALGLCLLEGIFPSIAAGIYAAVLTGGAHQCLQRRILSRQ